MTWPKHIIILACFSLSLSSFAGLRDSLLVTINSKAEPAVRADALIDLSNYYFNRDLDSCLFFTSNAIGVAKANELNYQWAVGESMLGQMAQKRKDETKALDHFNAVIDIGLKSGSERIQIIGHYRKGMLFAQSAKYSRAIRSYIRALEMSEEAENYSYASEICTQMGSCFRELKVFSKSFDYYAQALAYSKLSQDQEIGDATIYTHIGNVYKDLNNIDSCLNYYHKAEIIYEKILEPVQLMAIYSNLGQAYSLKTNQIAKGSHYLQQSLAIAEKYDDRERIIRNTISLAQVDLRQGRVRTARDKLLQAEELNNTEQILFFWPYIHGNLSQIYETIGEHEEALNRERLSNRFKDSILNKEKIELTQTLDAQYTQENSEKRALAAKNEMLTLQSKSERVESMLLFFGLALGVVLFGWFLYSRYFTLRRRTERLEDERNRVLQQQRISELQNVADMRAMNAMLDGRESERRAIATTLHDSVSTLLSSANMHLQAIKKRVNGEAAGIDKSQTIIKEAAEKIRLLSHELMSSVLVKFGMRPAIIDLCEKLSNEELEFDYEFKGLEKRINRDVENKLYSIIEELFNNIIKHSKASQANLILDQQENKISILVSDNGIGFDSSTIGSNDGIGLSHMRARVKGMGGKLRIDTQKEKGSRISISVPLQKQLVPST